jgi:HD superfamily phosphohydrolase
MRRSRPWGLQETWLTPCKVIRDPIHGDVFTNRLEQELIDSAAFQRLRRVRQLHTTHLVYPGATHSRFSHALGTLRVAQDLIDRVLNQRFGHRAVEDLFSEWDPETSPQLGAKAAEGAALRDDFVLKVAEATVLARLGALLHDLGHLPFSHTIEDDLRLLPPHDANELRMSEVWDEMIEDVAGRLRGRCESELVGALGPLQNERSELRRNLRPLLLGKARVPRGFEPKYRFVLDIVGDTICADLLDYLQRDHYYAGLPVALGDRFMSAFYVTPSARGAHPQRMALLLHRQGRRRVDIDDEVLKHLRYRYELTERVYFHHTKLAADAMLGRMLQHAAAALADDPDLLPATDRREALKATPIRSRARRNDNRSDQDRRLEDVLLSWGDDGLLEIIAAARSEHPRLARASDLARALLRRDLYAHGANASGAFGAEDLLTAFGSPRARAQLESQAAAWAGIADDDQLLLWLPPAGMRLKLAEVLVDHGRGIAKFKDYSTEGQEIYAAHRRLWTMSLFFRRDVNPRQRRAATAFIAREMNVCWDSYERALGPVPSKWPATAAAMESLHVDEVTDHVRTLVADHHEFALAARGSSASESHEKLVGRLTAQARTRGWVAGEVPRTRTRGVDDV